MKKLKLKKFKIAQLNRLDHILGGQDPIISSTRPKCPSETVGEALEDPDLPTYTN